MSGLVHHNYILFWNVPWLDNSIIRMRWKKYHNVWTVSQFKKSRMGWLCGGTRLVNLFGNSLIGYEWGKDRIVITTNGTYPWSYIRWLLNQQLLYDNILFAHIVHALHSAIFIWLSSNLTTDSKWWPIFRKFRKFPWDFPRAVDITMRPNFQRLIERNVKFHKVIRSNKTIINLVRVWYDALSALESIYHLRANTRVT
jgi:hypothetical protein